MFVLKIIGFVLLGLLLLLLLAGMFLLFARWRIDFRGKNGEVEVRFGLGPFRLKIWPQPEFSYTDEPEKPKKPRKPRKPKKPKKSRYSVSFKELDYGDTLAFILELLVQMKDKLVLETVLLNAIFATEDAAKTGLLLGGASAAAGIVAPFLEQNFNVNDLHITLDADFNSNKTKWAAVLVFAVRPISVLHVLLHNRRQLYALYKQIVRKVEAKET